MAGESDLVTEELQARLLLDLCEGRVQNTLGAHARQPDRDFENDQGTNETRRKPLLPVAWETRDC